MFSRSLDLVYNPIFMFLMGACWGSFSNVVLHRVPLRESIAWPGSACPKCHHPIAWYDNIPILSWLVLRARCRHCKCPISAQYPAVEAAVALLFLGAFLVHPLQPWAGMALSFGAWTALIGAALIMRKTRFPRIWFGLAALIAVFYLFQLGQG